MDGAYLKVIAQRCLLAATTTADLRAKDNFQDIAAELIRKANEVDGLIPAVAISRRAPDYDLRARAPRRAGTEDSGG